MARKPKAKPKPKTETKPEEYELTPEELAKLVPVDAPLLYASTFRLMGSGNDFTLVLQRTRPLQREDETIHEAVGGLETVGILTLSPQSFKDLYLLFKGQIESHEKEFGVIETPYTKRLAKENS